MIHLLLLACQVCQQVKTRARPPITCTKNVFSPYSKAGSGPREPKTPTTGVRPTDITSSATARGNGFVVAVYHKTVDLLLATMPMAFRMLKITSSKLTMLLHHLGKS
ncbi:hypothetical protein F5B17DRAFT_174440 [Nemania serpens]|nr:hypothetical protein F5B17DRAFT_174440 [Nemania serpens]